LKSQNVIELLSRLPDEERVVADVLRQIILSSYPNYIKEKISYNVPFFHANRGIAIIWPASVPRGGIKSGVLLGFWYGNRLRDVDRYLLHGTNKQIFYKIFQTADEIDDRPILKLLAEAVKLDKGV
jgi:hypothetical protein